MLDELLYGALGAAWPLLRRGLGLGYGEIGLLLAVPELASALVEPLVGLAADGRRRRTLVVAGGVAFAAAWLAAAVAPGWPPLLAAFAVAWPASGTFVSLTQATLVDVLPQEREQAPARWTLAGSAGVVCGPLLVAAGLGWRGAFAGLGLAALPLALLLGRLPVWGAGDGESLRAAARALRVAARSREVLRWLAVLELADLMLDGLTDFLALYLVDAAGATAAHAALGVAVWTGAGLAGDALLLLVLRRVGSRAWLRVSALAALAVFPGFLLVPGFWPKLVPLALLGVLNSGWYAIPKARLYAALPGRSGLATALGSLAGAASAAVPAGLGALAAAVGVGDALWVALLAPPALLAATAKLRS